MTRKQFIRELDGKMKESCARLSKDLSKTPDCLAVLDVIHCFRKYVMAQMVKKKYKYERRTK